MWILTNWRLVLIASLSLGLLLTISRLETATAERDLARSDLASYKKAAEDAATTAKAQSDRVIQEINRDHQALLDKTKNDALKNYLAKYGSSPASCSTVLKRMQPGDSLHNSEAGSAEGSDGVPEQQRLFIEACARDAGVVAEWHRWAELNQLPVSR